MTSLLHCVHLEACLQVISVGLLDGTKLEKIPSLVERTYLLGAIYPIVSTSPVPSCLIISTHASANFRQP